LSKEGTPLPELTGSPIPLLSDPFLSPEISSLYNPESVFPRAPEKIRRAWPSPSCPTNSIVPFSFLSISLGHSRRSPPFLRRINCPFPLQRKRRSPFPRFPYLSAECILFFPRPEPHHTHISIRNNLHLIILPFLQAHPFDFPRRDSYSTRHSKHLVNLHDPFFPLCWSFRQGGGSVPFTSSYAAVLLPPLS